MTAFHDVRFPLSISLGSSGGPERRTEIVTLANGCEERNALWSNSRRSYDAGYGVRSLDDIAIIIAFFEARNGRLYAFRWHDITDYSSSKPSLTPSPKDQFLGKGDGNNKKFRLIKKYSSGSFSYERTITHPVLDSLRVAVDGIEEKTSAWGFSQGEIIFNMAPAPGKPVTAGYQFDVPVRFDTDRLIVNVPAFQAGEIPSIPLVEVRSQEFGL